MNRGKISILMPAYNAEPFIGEAIRSVIEQTYTNWELIVVDDGSIDRTWEIASRFHDPRIRCFRKPNGGIGSARNMALDHVTGEYICGLDSDDVLPPDSLAARMAVFDAHPDTDMVDGVVQVMDKDLQNTIRSYAPRFEGRPMSELARLTGSCFMGFSWLIRWPQGCTNRFNEEISHGEDLLFYLQYAPGRMYRFTREPVLIYRRTGTSVMTDLAGLERSYRQIGRWIMACPDIGLKDKLVYTMKRKRIIAASHVRTGHWGRAFLSLLY